PLFVNMSGGRDRSEVRHTRILPASVPAANQDPFGANAIPFTAAPPARSRPSARDSSLPSGHKWIVSPLAVANQRLCGSKAALEATASTRWTDEPLSADRSFQRTNDVPLKSECMGSRK